MCGSCPGETKSVVDVEVMTDQLVYYFQPESEDDSKIDLLMKAVKNLPVKCQQVLVAICFNEKKIQGCGRGNASLC